MGFIADPVIGPTPTIIIFRSDPAHERPALLPGEGLQRRKQFVGHTGTTIGGLDKKIIEKTDLRAAQR